MERCRNVIKTGAIVKRKTKENHWCEYPKRCLCDVPDLEASRNPRRSLLRSSRRNPLRSLGETSYGTLDNDNEAEVNLEEVEVDMHFEEVPGRVAKVKLQPGLLAIQLCDQLAAEFGISSACDYSIYEHWNELNVERVIEDHENMMQCYKNSKMHSSRSTFRYIFGRNESKYAQFEDGVEVFVEPIYRQLRDNQVPFQEQGINSAYESDSANPIYTASVRFWQRKKGWVNMRLLVRNRCLYKLPPTLDRKFAFVFGPNGTFSEAVQAQQSSDKPLIQFLANLENCSFYTSVHKDRQKQWLVVRPDGGPSGDAGADIRRFRVRFFDCRNLPERARWYIILRIAKFGRQIKLNYRAYKKKKETGSKLPLMGKDSGDHPVPQSFVPRSRFVRSPGGLPLDEINKLKRQMAQERNEDLAYMDFSTGVGRIIPETHHEPDKNVIEYCQNCLRDFCVTQTRISSFQVRHKEALSRIENGDFPQSHIYREWYHPGLTRDDAKSLGENPQVISHEGLFFVRKCGTTPGNHVLNYVCDGKISHALIRPSIYNETDQLYFTIDEGVNRFLDIVTLVEYYLLNPLSRKKNEDGYNVVLNHYLVHPIRNDGMLLIKPYVRRKSIRHEASSGIETFGVDLSPLADFDASFDTLSK